MNEKNEISKSSTQTVEATINGMKIKIRKSQIEVVKKLEEDGLIETLITDGDGWVVDIAIPEAEEIPNALINAKLESLAINHSSNGISKKLVNLKILATKESIDLEDFRKLEYVLDYDEGVIKRVDKSNYDRYKNGKLIQIGEVEATSMEVGKNPEKNLIEAFLKKILEETEKANKAEEKKREAKMGWRKNTIFRNINLPKIRISSRKLIAIALVVTSIGVITPKLINDWKAWKNLDNAKKSDKSQTIPKDMEAMQKQFEALQEEFLALQKEVRGLIEAKHALEERLKGMEGKQEEDDGRISKLEGWRIEVKKWVDEDVVKTINQHDERLDKLEEGK